MRAYPALRLTFFEPPTQEQLDHLLAQLDDYHPTAIDDVPNGLVAFFATPDERDAAAIRFGGFELLDVASEDVADENWAARSQAALTPVTVGRLTISPPWAVTDDLRRQAAGPVITIQPSMGFGTGHHASTRLCLELLQTLDLGGKLVLDIGTGSGVLALCARALGARHVVGIDVDPDAIVNARENLALNGITTGVVFVEADLSSPGEHQREHDIVVANLTGAMLAREAARISQLAAPRAHLIISGFQHDETQTVTASFTGWTVVGKREEASWVGVLLTR